MSRYDYRWAHKALTPEPKDYRQGCRDYKGLINPGEDDFSFWQAERKEAGTYTGRLLIGIATMHKSNAIPVTRDGGMAEATAKMRRG